MSNELNNLYVGELINHCSINTFSVAYLDIAYLDRYGEFKLSSGNRLLSAEVSYIDKDYVLSYKDYYNKVIIILNKY